jgi:hypothetical protein
MLDIGNRFLRATTVGAAVAVLATGLSVTAPRDAQALTFILDFDNNATDIFGQTAGAFTQGSFNSRSLVCAFLGMQQRPPRNTRSPAPHLPAAVRAPLRPVPR